LEAGEGWREEGREWGGWCGMRARSIAVVLVLFVVRIEVGLLGEVDTP